jgi:hypothetical protein
MQQREPGGTSRSGNSKATQTNQNDDDDDDNNNKLQSEID